MNGLEGKRGKKTRHEGGERGEGMTERGTEQWKGSSPEAKPCTAQLLLFRSHCKGKVRSGRKLGPSTGGICRPRGVEQDGG